ncbi:hypothetical protein Dimus_015644 [Dionaea muscipula]
MSLASGLSCGIAALVIGKETKLDDSWEQFLATSIPKGRHFNSREIGTQSHALVGIFLNLQEYFRRWLTMGRRLAILFSLPCEVGPMMWCLNQRVCSAVRSHMFCNYLHY